MRGRRWFTALVAPVAVLALATGACTHEQTTAVKVDNPGDCTPVDVAAPSETADLLGAIAHDFNASPAAKVPRGTCVFVRVETVDANSALGELVAGWPDVDRLGPAPAVWAPPSGAWPALLGARLAAAHQAPLPTSAVSFARSPMVVAMPAPMARALQARGRTVGWSDLARLAAVPAGWGAENHRAWGRFRFGFANPTWSTPALDATIAWTTSGAFSPAARALQGSVVYYADTDQRYLDTWTRLAAPNPVDAFRFASAVVTDERSVAVYNQSRPKLPLVAIYPHDGAVSSDYPLVTLAAPWTTPAARAGARAFSLFARSDASQRAVANTGLRPVRGPANATLLSARNGVAVTPPNQVPAGAVAPALVQRAVAAWQEERKHARVLVVFDESDSMGDLVDQTQPDGPTKIELARPALARALPELSPGDQIELRVFTTKLPAHPSPNWAVVVPMGRYDARRVGLQGAVRALRPRQGSPLYAAIRDGYGAIAHRADPRTIDAVVILTDGYNEDDHYNKLAALLSTISTNHDVRVFTIPFGDLADYTTLKTIAETTNGQLYDARNVYDVGLAFREALASF